ncbi:MAG: lysine--tRNA ligase [Zetaproteobacteria bacterium]|nr:MAG: lysine--tRNA ligase [Zetaproteobacteria bacterium]
MNARPKGAAAAGPTGDPEQVAVRRRKLAALREEGFAYPDDWRCDAEAAALHERYGDWEGVRLEEAAISVRVGGRIMAHRVMGRSSFLHIQDGSGRIQLFLQRDRLTPELYDATKAWDLGDIVGAAGTLFRTRTGELSVRVEEIRLVAKCLRPLPEKWKGLQDKELRYRRRYLDLMVSSEARDRFRLRSRIVAELRRRLEARGFIEVETPMLQLRPGGAAARPFITHHNALDIDLYLRIAPELYLKRLVVGGFERVFEINRNFRNEGLDATHNPEFTMVEFYQAWADFHDAMETTEALIRGVAEACGRTRIVWEGVELDLGRPFRRLRMDEAVVEKRPDLAGHTRNKGLLATVCLQEIPDFRPTVTWQAGDYLNALFEALVEPELQQPTFVTHHPVEISPLARRNGAEPHLTDRFELFVAGKEIANGFSELNDPDDQRARFLAQAAARQAEEGEPAGVDEDFLCALEYGMPPTAGVGIGVDRLVMMLTGSHSIRDVLLFPHMRPQE